MERKDRGGEKEGGSDEGREGGRGCVGGCAWARERWHYAFKSAGIMRINITVAGGREGGREQTLAAWVELLRSAPLKPPKPGSGPHHSPATLWEDESTRENFCKSCATSPQLIHRAFGFINKH